MPMCACNTANAGLSNASDSTAMACVERKEENDNENNFKVGIVFNALLCQDRHTDLVHLLICSPL